MKLVESLVAEIASVKALQGNFLKTKDAVQCIGVRRVARSFGPRPQT